MANEIIKKVCSDSNIQSIALNYLTKYDERYNELKPFLDWYFNLFKGNSFSDKEITFVINKVKDCKDEIENIDKYFDYKNKKTNASQWDFPLLLIK